MMLSKLTAANGVSVERKSIAASLLLCAALTWCSSAIAQSTLQLTSAGRAAIWKSLGKDATDTQLAAGLKVGEKIPDPMNVLPFTARVRKKVPAIKPYSYALVNGQVLIVDAQTRKIVAIVSK
jgi:uncharacterized protein DUF1236